MCPGLVSAKQSAFAESIEFVEFTIGKTSGELPITLEGFMEYTSNNVEKPEDINM
jgi:hypothetical protein